MRCKLITIVLVCIGSATAQDQGKSEASMLQEVLNRLQMLEQQNKELKDEVHTLREELNTLHPHEAKDTSQAANTAAPSVEERVQINASRIDEQAQTKVEASQRFPIQLTGMFLFNAFSNTEPQPSTTSRPYQEVVTGPNTSGATLRQSMIGVRFRGPSLPGGGKVFGDLMMDFYGGGSQPLSSWLRIRRGTLSFDWPDRTFSVGQDKPLIAPRSPDSLAEVGVPPLSGSGNLWLWLPQARYEERIHLGAASGLIAQTAVLQTYETYASVPDEYVDSLEPTRPAIEGRIAYWHKWDDTRRFEVGSGLHSSVTHVAGNSVDSRLWSLDGIAVPWSKLQFTGNYFAGRNPAALGGLPDGYSINEDGHVSPVHAKGGWLQISSPLTSRLTLNVFGGVQNNRVSDLLDGQISRNLSYAANMMYRIAPNVIISLEGLQTRTQIVGQDSLVRNRYDLGMAYLF
jgi:hypothetical protein